MATSKPKVESLVHVASRSGSRTSIGVDTLDPGHFGPKTFRHHQTGAEMSGPPANIFATIGHTEESLVSAEAANVCQCIFGQQS